MLQAIDLPLFHLLNAGAGSPAGYINAARWVSAWLPGISMALLTLWMVWQGPAGLRRLGRTAAALALAWLACRLIRWGLPMPRPAFYGLGLQWIAHNTGAGMPSMHAAGAFALAMAIQLGWARQQRWLPAVVWTLATLVALSRVVLGVHFPSDILAGLLVGCASAWLVWRVSRAPALPSQESALAQRMPA
ncbi:MAG: phosphatase PAP2 family protein [Acidovorax sp.]|jgi:undecaprenyl-diphosphatase|nr:phosphatase PAP2 family protein [Acidovorax sp.]